MQLSIGDLYHGFRLQERKKLEDIDAIAWIFLHEKSGAKLMYMQNEDDNKVFFINFKTPPEDSTGLPHILEHSVLCGSRKFPCKEPFVELLKGSLNTYLNAMTFSDKTMYPVASRNNQDFMNLMDVYLDAVLYPNIYKKPEIFMQEGWHYELDQEDDEIVYKGVVYNEMKGAFSSPEGVLGRKIQESLFPDTPYGVESGGDPEHIPDLTPAQFLDFHKTHYHPSNSHIYIYGNGEIMSHLQFLHEEYLNDFDVQPVGISIPRQKPFEVPREMTEEYSILEDEKEEDKTFLSLNFVVGEATDGEKVMAFDILRYLLLQTPAAPLKRALMDANIGKDVFGSYDNHILQPVWSVIVKNSNEVDKERFVQIVMNTLQKLVQEGIDKKLIEGAINIREFYLREADYGYRPKGLVYGIGCMSSWLYDGDPTIHLEYSKHLQKIREALDTPYFENLIKDFLLYNSHRSLLVVKPKRGLSAEKEKQVKKKLEDYKQTLSHYQVHQLVASTKSIKEMQNIPDPPEALASIPTLSLSDIEKKAESIPRMDLKEEGIQVLFHPLKTNQILYLDLLFDASVIPQALIPYAGLLTYILGKVGTEQYSYEALSNEINIYTGGITCKMETYTQKENSEVFFPKWSIRSKVLAHQMPKLFDLLVQIIKHSYFHDKTRSREIIAEVKSRLERAIFEQGNAVAAGRVCSYFSTVGKYREQFSGIDFYHFIAELDADFTQRADEISQKLQKVASLLFQKRGLLVNVTTEEAQYEACKTQLLKFQKVLPDQTGAGTTYTFDMDTRNEGFMTSAKVQYVAKGANFRKLGHAYSGKMSTLLRILSLDYLWNQVRVQGGAYGCSVSFQRNGNMIFSSYRDPNLVETLEVYDQASTYVKNFTADEREMTKYIIGAINRLDAPMTPSQKGEVSTSYVISGITQEDLQKERDEVLETKQEDIRAIATMIEEGMKEEYICVVGNEDKIKQNKEVFDQLIHIFK